MRCILSSHNHFQATKYFTCLNIWHTTIWFQDKMEMRKFNLSLFTSFQPSSNVSYTCGKCMYPIYICKPELQNDKLNISTVNVVDEERNLPLTVLSEGHNLRNSLFSTFCFAFYCTLMEIKYKFVNLLNI